MEKELNVLFIIIGSVMILFGIFLGLYYLGIFTPSFMRWIDFIFWISIPFVLIGIGVKLIYDEVKTK